MNALRKIFFTRSFLGCPAGQVKKERHQIRKVRN
jgi:hypothetical protein